MDMLLKGKRALITGSTSGIGAQCARVLAGEGASVVINGSATWTVSTKSPLILAVEHRADPNAIIETSVKGSRVEFSRSEPHVYPGSRRVGATVGDRDDVTGDCSGANGGKFGSSTGGVREGHGMGRSMQHICNTTNLSY